MRMSTMKKTDSAKSSHLTDKLFFIVETENLYNSLFVSTPYCDRIKKLTKPILFAIMELKGGQGYADEHNEKGRFCKILPFNG